ncbi:hypothetical protein HK096_001670, partial [Nowakowskiella sp. JEL0078]
MDKSIHGTGTVAHQVVSDKHIDWFMGFYKQNPLAFLDEAKFAYEKMFAASI